MEVEENLLTKIEIIDAEHKEIISLVNQFNSQNSTEDKQVILKNLYDKCSSHFLTEELLMKKIEFPYFLVHKMEHDKQLTTLKTFIFLFLDSIMSEKHSFIDIIQSMVYDWLVPHIKDYDLIFANFYKTRN